MANACSQPGARREQAQDDPRLEEAAAPAGEAPERREREARGGAPRRTPRSGRPRSRRGTEKPLERAPARNFQRARRRNERRVGAPRRAPSVRSRSATPRPAVVTTAAIRTARGREKRQSATTDSGGDEDPLRQHVRVLVDRQGGDGAAGAGRVAQQVHLERLAGDVAGRDGVGRVPGEVDRRRVAETTDAAAAGRRPSHHPNAKATCASA